MNAQDALTALFPGGNLSHISPDHGGMFEVNGLSEGTVPQNCEILLTGEGSLSLPRCDRRTHYLVRADGVLFFFRICTAMKGSGYAEYVAGLGFAETSQASADLVERARRIISACCTVPEA